MVSDGTFREDLYSRIRCWEFQLPGIRDLPKDFEESVNFEIKVCNSEEFRKGNSQPFRVFFEDDAKGRFLEFGVSDEAKWTGNFRDLKFSIRRMFVKAKLNESTINMENVVEEIERLRKFWQISKDERGIDLPGLLSRLEKIAREKFPGLHLMDALEALMLSEGLEKLDNKALVARWLYETSGKLLRNPSSRFRERHKSLFGS